MRAHGRRWAFLVVLLLGVPTPLFADEPAPGTAKDKDGDPYEPVLSNEEQRAYDKEFHGYERRYLKIELPIEMHALLDAVEQSGTRAARDWAIQLAKKVKSAEYRARAFAILVKIGGKPSMEVLLGKHGVKSGDFNVQVQAAAALEKTTDKRCVPVLLELLAGPALKMEALGQICLTVGRVGHDDPKVEEALFLRIHEKRDTVRARVVEGLGHVKTVKAFNHVLHSLKEKSATVREGAAKGLGHAGRQEAVPVLQAAAKDDNSQPVRAAALESLKQLGAPPK
jgi:hypothetical protein